MAQKPSCRSLQNQQPGWPAGLQDPRGRLSPPQGNRGRSCTGFYQNYSPFHRIEKLDNKSRNSRLWEENLHLPLSSENVKWGPWSADLCARGFWTKLPAVSNPGLCSQTPGRWRDFVLGTLCPSGAGLQTQTGPGEAGLSSLLLGRECRRPGGSRPSPHHTPAKGAFGLPRGLDPTGVFKTICL